MFWTLLKKDGLRMRTALLGYGALIIVQNVLSLPWITDRFWLFDWLKYTDFYFQLAGSIIAGIMIPMLIQDDAVAGVRAFHLTRPISRRVLLAEKVLFGLTVFAVFPTLLQVGVLLIHGVPVQYAPAAFGTLIKNKCLFFIFFMMAASMTRTIRQYLTAVAVALAITGLFTWALTVFPDQVLENPLNLDGRNISLEWSIGIVSFAVSAVLCLFIIWNQFIRRETRKSIVCLVFFILIGPLIGRFWSWDFLQMNNRICPRLGPGMAPELAIDQKNFYVGESSDNWKKRVPDYKICVRETVDPLGPRRFAKARQVRGSRFVFSNGRILGGGQETGMPKGVLSACACNDINGAQFVEPLRDLFPDDTVIFGYSAEPKSHWPALSWISSRDFEKLKNVPARYSAQQLFDVYEYRVAARIPVRKGSQGVARNDVFRIYDYDTANTKTDPFLVIEEKNGNFPASFLDTQRNFSFDDDIEFDEPFYVLRNPARKETFLPKSKYTFSRGSLINEAMIERFVGFYYSDSCWNCGPLPQIDADWLAGAELLRVEAVRIGHSIKKISLNGIRMGDKRKDYELKDGVRVFFYPTGEKWKEEPDGPKDRLGTVKEYYKSGALKSEYPMMNGALNGTVREYYETGELMYEMEYKDDALNGHVRKYSPDGTVISDRVFVNDRLAQERSREPLHPPDSPL